MKSQFINRLHVHYRSTSDGQRFVILDLDFRYYSALLGRQVKVPAGFFSDGASVPRILHWLYHPYGRYLEAAVVHDWFCVQHNISSVTAAKVFLEAMEVCGVPAWRRNKMYWAVRMFGPRFKRRED